MKAWAQVLQRAAITSMLPSPEPSLEQVLRVNPAWANSVEMNEQVVFGLAKASAQGAELQIIGCRIIAYYLILHESRAYLLMGLRRERAIPWAVLIPKGMLYDCANERYLDRKKPFSY